MRPTDTSSQREHCNECGLELAAHAYPCDPPRQLTLPLPPRLPREVRPTQPSMPAVRPARAS